MYRAITASLLNSAIFRDFFRLEIRAAGITPVLRAVRQHLDMDVAFLARFRKGDRVFDHVDADGCAPIRIGQAVSLEHGYCLRVVQGQLPALIPDTSLISLARSLPETTLIPIGAHLSVPVVLASGTVYGTLCCFSHRAKPKLNKTDLQLLRDLAAVISSRLEDQESDPHSIPLATATETA